MVTRASCIYIYIYIHIHAWFHRNFIENVYIYIHIRIWGIHTYVCSCAPCSIPQMVRSPHFPLKPPFAHSFAALGSHSLPFAAFRTHSLPTRPYILPIYCMSHVQLIPTIIQTISILLLLLLSPSLYYTCTLLTLYTLSIYSLCTAYITYSLFTGSKHYSPPPTPTKTLKGEG